MPIKCELREGSTKEGKKYIYLYIDQLDKMIFLNKTEIKLLQLLNK